MASVPQPKVTVAAAGPRGRGGEQVAAAGPTVGPRAGDGECCCPYLHEAVELVGKRWTGAIVYVLLHGGSLRFSEICQKVPQISDRLLSERMKELEARGIVERRVHAESPVRVEYELTEMGHALAPALRELKAWAEDWL